MLCALGLGRAAALVSPSLGASLGRWALISRFQAAQHTDGLWLHTCTGSHAPADASDNLTKPTAASGKSKRLPSGYTLFVKDFAKQHQEGDKRDLLQRASRAYKGLGEQEKQNYKEKARIHNQPALDAAAAAAAEQKAAHAEQKAARKAKHMNAYSAYIQRNFASARSASPGTTPTEVLSKLAQAWKQLTPEQKAEYKPESKAAS